MGIEGKVGVRSENMGVESSRREKSLVRATFEDLSNLMMTVPIISMFI